MPIFKLYLLIDSVVKILVLFSQDVKWAPMVTLADRRSGHRRFGPGLFGPRRFGPGCFGQAFFTGGCFGQKEILITIRTK